MSNYPSYDQFYALSQAHNLYSEQISTSWAVIQSDYENHPADENIIAEIVSRAEKLSAEAFEACFDDQSWLAFEWLEARPEFKLAKQAIGFRPLSEVGGYANRFEQTIRYCIERKWQTFPPCRQIIRQSGKHILYVSSLSAEIADFLSGRALRAAIDGDATFDKMLALAEDVGKLTEADWIPDHTKNLILFNVRRLSAAIDRHRPPIPISKRNDADLPARLMAAGFIRIHLSMFSATHKRAVFNLMGLPIVDRFLEMRTIERLAKAEKERQHSENERQIATKERHRAK